MQGIYMILNENNGKCYVGQSVDIERRWGDHKRDKTDKHLYNSFRKYGLDWFSFHVLEEVKIKDNLTDRELFWYDILKPEYNLMRPTEPKNVIDNVPVLKIDKKSFEILEEYNSIRAAERDTEAYGSNISYVCNGKKISAGGYYWCYKDDWYDGWKPRLSNHCKTVLMIDIETKEILKEFSSVLEASHTTGIHNGNIGRVCGGGRKTAGGYLWRYKK